MNDENNNYIEVHRNAGVDLIKAVSIIAIIITHYTFSEDTRAIFVFPYLINLAMPCLMIITGYNAGNRNGIFTYKNTLTYLVRLFPAWLIAMFVEIYLFRSWKSMSIYNIYQTLIVRQNYGQGSYFPWVYLKLTVLLPLIDLIIRKLRRLGLAGLIVLNLLFEIFVSLMDMDPVTYRLASMRYLGFVAVGLYYGRFKCSVKKKNLVLGAVIGGFIVYFLNYHEPLFLFKQWRSTSLPVILFAFVFVYIIIEDWHFKSRFIEIIARSTFHIFLVQMIYYRFYYQYVANLIKPAAIRIIINLLICIPAGMVFWSLDKQITNMKMRD